MDMRDGFNLVLGVLVALMGWIMKELWDGHKQLQRDLDKLSDKMATNFATKEEINDAKALISGSESRLNARIDRSENNISGQLKSVGDTVISHYQGLMAAINMKVDK